MKLINAILEDLKAAAKDLQAGQITREEFNRHMDMLISRVNRIGINFEDTKIRNYQDIFKQKLWQRKYKAVSALKGLQEARNTRIFNARGRQILETKLFFGTLHGTISRNMHTYESHATTRNAYKLKDNIQIFIENEVQEHE